MKGKINIFEDLEGRKIVMIHDVRFKGKRKINWKKVEVYLKEYVGECYEIAETAEKIYIGSEFPDEYAESKDTKSLNGTWAKAKANAAQGLPQIIQIATGKTFAPNYEEKHSKDAKYGWYRYDSRFAQPVYDEEGEIHRYNVFSVRMLVRHAQDHKKYLYDFLRIKKKRASRMSNSCTVG